MRVLALGLILAAAVNASLMAARGHSVPAERADVKLDGSGTLETAFLFGLGMRRLAADLGVIRLILYYGGPDEKGEGGCSDPSHGHLHFGHDEFDPDHPERHRGGGSYRRLGPMAMRALDLDPSFPYPALFAAGALAFNLNQPEEALEVIRYAMKRDPKNIRYRQYVAAIGAHRKGTPEGAIEMLEKIVQDPDCPTMIKNMLGFLYLRNGRRQDAIELYREMRDTTRDHNYRDLAERMVRKLEG